MTMSKCCTCHLRARQKPETTPAKERLERVTIGVVTLYGDRHHFKLTWVLEASNVKLEERHCDTIRKKETRVFLSQVVSPTEKTFKACLRRMLQIPGVGFFSAV